MPPFSRTVCVDSKYTLILLTVIDKFADQLEQSLISVLDELAPLKNGSISSDLERPLTYISVYCLCSRCATCLR